MLVLLFYLHRHGLASKGRDPSTHPKAVSRYSWTTIHYTWPSPCFSLIFKVKLSSKFLRTEARLAIGLIALVILIIMATTSNRWAMHRLKKNWKRLHRQCTYVVFLVGRAYFALFEGRGEVFVYVFLLSLFLILRIPPVKKKLTLARLSYHVSIDI